MSSSSAAAIAAMACLAVLATACGGSAAGHVAQLGSTATERGASASTTSEQATGAVAFSRCMRSHGVPAFPDPASGGQIPKKTARQLGISPSGLQAAQSACIHLVPNGGRPTPAQIAQYRSVMLIYARCMRAHGVSNMPDPDSRGHLDIGPGSGVAVNGPRFQDAYQRCKSKLSP